MIEPTPTTEAPERFIAVMGRAATPVSVVTTDGPAGRCGVTVSAVSSVSADPPLVLACINRKSPAVAAIAENGVFAISFLSDEAQGIAETFAGRPRAGRPYDFSAHAWDTGAQGQPIASGAAAAFECRTEASYDAGTHRIFIGRVLAATGGEAEPLIYCNRAFRRTVDLKEGSI